MAICWFRFSSPEVAAWLCSHIKYFNFLASESCVLCEHPISIFSLKNKCLSLPFLKSFCSVDNSTEIVYPEDCL